MIKRHAWSVRAVGLAGVVVLVASFAGTAFASVPVLTQTNITVGVGQSLSVSSTNGVSLYMGLNSNPTVASVSMSGIQATVTGISLGSTGITVCAVGTASDCTNLNVTVQSGNVSVITLNPSSLSLSVGGNQSVAISGGNGNYTISGNSNTTVVSTGLSGNTLTISGLAAGGSTINICDTSGACATLPATIGSSGTSSSIQFSQNNISLTAGGSLIVTMSGGSGTYRVSSNSNANVISANISSSNAVTIYATAAGTASVTVCDISNDCGTFSVTVAAAPTTNQAVTFSIPSPALAVGQSLSDVLSGGASGYVVLSNINSNIAQASISGGSTLSLSGLSAGADTVTVCATGGGCSPVSVTVSGLAATTTAGTVVTTPVVTTPVVSPSIVPSSGGVVNTAILGEIQTLQSAVTQLLVQIQSIQVQLNQLASQVNNSGGGAVVTNSSAGGGSYDFTQLLTLGSTGVQVSALQERLISLGLYSGTATGFYGSLTQQAVMKYQSSHGITATGYVGPSTRAALNMGN